MERPWYQRCIVGGRDVFPALILLSALVAEPVSTAAAPAIERDERVVITGNLVMLEEVYRALLDLPKDAEIDRRTASRARAKILGFLRRSGYVLAQVGARVEDGKLHLEIDEGRLDKIIYPKLGAFSTVRMRLELVLPYDVFNRDSLVRQLKEISERHNYKNTSWELVRTASVTHEGPQLEDVPDLEDSPLVPEPGIYELHINVEEGPARLGLSPRLAYESPDGLQVGLRYNFGEIFWDDELWSARTGVGIRVQDVLSSGAGRRFISRVEAALEYSSPEVFLRDMRVLVSLRALGLSRQRIDLDILSYDYILVDPTIRLKFSRIEWLSLSAGAGAEYRNLFDIDEGVRPRPRIDPVETIRPFILGSAEVIFDPSNLRDDRRERILLQMEHFFRAGSLSKATAEYSNTLLFGWNELRFGLGGSMVFGSVAFTDEISVGDYLRAVFSDDLYTTRIAGAGIEYRLSLSRDYFKVSVFHDGVAYAGIDRFTNETSPRLANAFGVGLHFLIADSFQLDVYGGIGFTHRRRDGGITLSASQAF